MTTNRSRRDAFEIAAGEIYLNGGANSPLPRAARLAVEEALRLQATPSLIPVEAFFSYADAIRERAGAALGLPANDVAVTTGTGFGMMLLAQGVRWKAGDRLLLGPDEFPSNAYPWFPLEERGVVLQHAGVAGRPLTVAQLTPLFDSGPPIRALSLAAVHYPTGDVHPLREIAEAVHARGALLFVDASQAAGAIDIDWLGSGVDAMAVSGYKWLFGPYGTGILWVRPEVREALVNVNGNWLAVEGARNMAQLMATYPRRYEAHGRVFDAGEVASYFNLSAFRAGLDVLLAAGVAAVEALHRSLQDRAVAGLADLPLRAVTDLHAHHRSPMLMLEPIDRLDLTRLETDLSARHVSVSLRMGRLRLSPGLWNDEADVDAFLDAVTAAAVAARGS